MAEPSERARRIHALEEQMHAARKELVGLLKEEARRPVEDALFQGPSGPVHLSALFGDKTELVLSFNMGTACAYCTCWGDAINGYAHHLQSYSAFACVSPDAPEIQAKFAAGRGWKFPMVSHGATDFAVDMGFATDKDGERHYGPGYATFRKTDAGIERVALEWYGPGDLYNGLFHMLSLLDSGGKGFVAKHAYATSSAS